MKCLRHEGPERFKIFTKAIVYGLRSDRSRARAGPGENNSSSAGCQSHGISRHLVDW